MPAGGRAALVTRRPDGTGRRRTRWAVAGGSYQSSSDTRLLFAWPAEETVELLEVDDPGGVRLRIHRPPDGVYLRFPFRPPEGGCGMLSPSQLSGRRPSLPADP